MIPRSFYNPFLQELRTAALGPFRGECQASAEGWAGFQAEFSLRVSECSSIE